MRYKIRIKQIVITHRVEAFKTSMTTSRTNDRVWSIRWRSTFIFFSLLKEAEVLKVIKTISIRPINNRRNRDHNVPGAIMCRIGKNSGCLYQWITCLCARWRLIVGLFYLILWMLECLSVFFIYLFIFLTLSACMTLLPGASYRWRRIAYRGSW